MTDAKEPTVTLTLSEVDAYLAVLGKAPAEYVRAIMNNLETKRARALLLMQQAKQAFDHEAAANAVVPTEPKVEPEVASAARNRAERRAATKNGRTA